MERVLITGAAGFVGSWLARELVARDLEVFALLRDCTSLEGVEPITGELQQIETLERAISECEIDTVFHLGAQAIVEVGLRSPFLTFESNIRGTYNLLEVCRRHPQLVKRILVASTDKAYGTSPILPYTEEMPLAGRHPYDVSKSCTDLISLCYAHTYGMPIVIARCGNIYGGGDLNWSRLIPGTIRSLVEGQAPVIRSDGTFTRDYLYVEDAVSAYIAMAEQADRVGVKGEAFNFGPQAPHTVLQVTHAIQEYMGMTHLKPLIENRARAEIRDQTLDFTKARTRLGWEPRFSLQEGLSRTIPWYLDRASVLNQLLSKH